MFRSRAQPGILCQQDQGRKEALDSTLRVVSTPLGYLASASITAAVIALNKCEGVILT